MPCSTESTPARTSAADGLLGEGVRGHPGPGRVRGGDRPRHVLGAHAGARSPTPRSSQSPTSFTQPLPSPACSRAVSSRLRRRHLHTDVAQVALDRGDVLARPGPVGARPGHRPASGVGKWASPRRGWRARPRPGRCSGQLAGLGDVPRSGAAGPHADVAVRVDQPRQDEPAVDHGRGTRHRRQRDPVPD